MEDFIRRFCCLLEDWACCEAGGACACCKGSEPDLARKPKQHRAVPMHRSRHINESISGDDASHLSKYLRDGRTPRNSPHPGRRRATEPARYVSNIDVDRGRSPQAKQDYLRSPAWMDEELDVVEEHEDGDIEKIIRTPRLPRHSQMRTTPRSDQSLANGVTEDGVNDSPWPRVRPRSRRRPSVRKFRFPRNHLHPPRIVQ